jgi:glucose-6-phosphate isomerase
MKYINPHDLTPIMGQEEFRAHAADYAATMRRAMSDKSYLLPESSLRLPFDNELFEKSRLLAEKLSTPNLSYVVVVGIGGSYLGTKAVYEAMCGTIDGYGPSLPKMIFADTCSPEFLGDLTGILV